MFPHLTKKKPYQTILISSIVVLVILIFISSSLINAPIQRITGLALGDVIHPINGTVVTEFGIATPKIGEMRMVDPGNASDIQAKIDSCPSNGCRIFIPVGNYTITNTIVINNSKNNIILEGAAPGHVDYDYVSGGTAFMLNANNVNIINITGNSSKMVDSILIENIYFNSEDKTGGRAIYVENVSDFKLINNFFYGFADSSAVTLKNTQGFLADHNNFWYCSAVANQNYCLEYLNAAPNNNTYANIVYNEFELSGSSYGALSVEYTNSSYIAGNIFEGVPYGIRAGNSSRITGNYFYLSLKRPIVSSHSDSIIEGNNIGTDNSATDLVAIYASGGMVTGNIVNRGIWLNGSQAKVTGNYISGSGNDSSGINGGLVLVDSNNSIVSNNVIKGVGTNTGILIKDNSNNNIVNSNSVNNYVTGINESVSSSGNNTITDNVVLGNTNPVSTTGTNTKVYKNMGYTTENKNTTSVVNGDYVAHGLATIPNYVKLTPTAYNMTAYLMSKNSTHIRIGLYYTTTGTNVTSSTNVTWYAEV
jgi:hypothetical protein